MKQVCNFLDRNTRRRYLYTLILCNDREKADLKTIKSEDSPCEPSVVQLKNTRKLLETYKAFGTINDKFSLLKVQKCRRSSVREQEVAHSKSCPQKKESRQ